MESKDHWEKVCTTKDATEVSWFQEHANEFHAEFSEHFLFMGHERESHHTPGGNEQ